MNLFHNFIFLTQKCIWWWQLNCYIRNYKPDGSFLYKTLWIPGRISCADSDNLGNTELKTLTDLNFNIVVIYKQRFCYSKPNQTRWIVPGSRNKQWMNKQWRNEFKAKKSNEDCLKFGSKMQLNNAATYTERGIDLSKVVNEKYQTGEEGRRSGAWLMSWASHFLPKMTVEAMKCHCDLPKVESQSFKATGLELQLKNCLAWSSQCKDTKRHALECDCYREELFHVSDEVTWTRRQHGLGFFTIGLLWGQD